MTKAPPVNIAIFASGAGSNAKKIIDYFRNDSRIKVALIVSDQPNAGVLQIAREENLPILELQKERFFNGDAYLPEFIQFNISFIVLAGFMRKIPGKLIAAYTRKIVNIHPALLPGFGGKGMYGSRVHEAVLKAGEKESGITIHYVDEVYDKGEVIFQEKCKIEEGETADTLANKIHIIEHACYPEVIEKVILEQFI
ncbi:MAG: phosphoribosylglycinamide formyltransferase [Chitinophagaceae bacterium]